MEVEGDLKNTSNFSIDSFENVYQFPTQLEQELSNRFENVINCFFTNKDPHEHYSELMRIINSLSMTINWAHFYSVLENCIIENIYMLVDSINRKLNITSFNILQYTNNQWVLYYNTIKHLRELLVSFDYYYCQAIMNKSFMNLCIDMWKSVLFSNKYENIQNRIYESLLSALNDKRRGKEIDIKTVESLTKMMLEMDLYHELFEPKVLESQSEYYTEEVNTLLEDALSNDFASYIQLFVNRVECEHLLCHECLYDCSEVLLERSLETIFMSEPLLHGPSNTMTRAITSLIKNNHNEELSTLYKYCNKLGMLTQLKDASCSFINNEGTEIYSTCKQYKLLIDSLIALNERITFVYSVCFENNSTLSSAIKSAFGSIIAEADTLICESLSRYMDACITASPPITIFTNESVYNNKSYYYTLAPVPLSQQAARINNPQFITSIQSCIILFTFLANKEEFEKKYKTYLAKRLLYYGSLYLLHERFIVDSLAQEKSISVQSLIVMLADVQKSYDFVSKYMSMETSYPITTTVVYKSMWPTYEEEDLKMNSDSLWMIPTSHQNNNYQEEFIHRYKQLYKRHIYFSYKASTFFIEMVLKQKVYHFYMNYSCFVVLSLFSKQISYSIQELSEQTGFNVSEIISILTPLLTIKLLTCNSKSMKESSILSFNSSFTYTSPPLPDILQTPKYKNCSLLHSYYTTINLETIESSLDNNYEANSVENTIISDNQLNAAIARFIKQSKTLSYCSLCTQLEEFFKVTLDSDQIKRCIENIINKDIICRDDSNPDILTYVP